MRIAIDAQLISLRHGYRSAGVSSYSLNLLRALGHLHAQGETDYHFAGFVNDESVRVGGVDLIQAQLPLHRALARIAWEQTLFPVQARRFDLVHGLVNVLPLAWRGPSVVTVHDLAFLHAAETMPPVRRAYLTALCRASASQATRIVAVSTQTADDLMRSFGTPARRIVVVPNGVGGEFTPGAPDRAVAYRAARGLPPRFFLFVGTLEPRKNLEFLVSAYARWRSEAPPELAEIKLVIAGGRGWYYQTIFEKVRSLGQETNILFPGFVPADDLPDLYRSALALVYPSRLEGFGLPVLEAMACGLPVLVSRTPSLVEVAGDAGVTFGPDDAAGLVNCLHLAAGQESLRAELRARGLERAALFSWRRTAQETLAVYEQAVNSAQPA